MQDRRAHQDATGGWVSSKGSVRLEAWLFKGMLALCVLLPLPLGSDRPLAWQAAGLMVAMLLIGTLFLPGDSLGGTWRNLRIPILLFAAAALFATLQSFGLTPSGWHEAIWAKASAALGHKLDGTIAADPLAAQDYLFRLIAYGGWLLVAVVLQANPQRAKAVVATVTLCGALYAFYGLVVYWSGNRTLLWFPKWAYGGDLTSTFVNRNSFATYLDLTLMAGLAKLGVEISSLKIYESRRDNLRILIEFLTNRWPVLLALCLIGTALLLTHSRGGFTAACAGVAALFIGMGAAPSIRHFDRVGLLLLPSLLLLCAVVINGEALANRFVEDNADGDERWQVDRLTVQAIAGHELLGSGLGSFDSVFPRYRTQAVESYYDRAHNDYLQTLLELGIPAGLGLMASVGWLAGRCIRGIRVRRRHAVFPCLGLAVTVLVACHATVDFSLQIPAVTMTWLLLLGSGVAQSMSRRRSDRYSDDHVPVVQRSPGA